MKDALAAEPEPVGKEQKTHHRRWKKQIKELEKHRDKLSEYDSRLEQICNRNSMPKTDPALFPNSTDTLTLIPFFNSFLDRYGHLFSVAVADSKTASGYRSENARYRVQNCTGCPLRCLCYRAKGDK